MIRSVAPVYVATVYLAGPDVFLPDAAAMLARKQQVCAAHGLRGVSPLDPPAEAPPPGLDEPRRIAWANEWHIRRSQAVLANLTPFRGPSADVGTVYELGYARALGLPVFGYSTIAAGFADRTRAFLAARPDGMAVETFGLSDNLMIDAGIAASGGALVVEDRPAAQRWTDLAVFTRCVALAARHLGGA